MAEDRPRPRDRSLFWPIVLIGAGIIWLLANFNVIPDVNLGLLVRLWPLFLIAAGFELLLGRGNPVVGGLMGLLTVGIAVALLLLGPQLGLASGTELKTQRFVEPLDGTESAEVTLGLAEFPTQLSALTDSNNLIDAELSYTGEIDFRVSGTTRKVVRLEHRSSFTGPWDWFNSFEGRWQIGLTPQVPLDLGVDMGSGRANLDLAAFQLTSLNLDGGSGALEVALPPGPDGEPYRAQLNGGSGSVDVRVPPAANASLEVDGGSGSITLDVPDDLAVRVEIASGGSGSVNLPNTWEQVRGGDDDEGTWQTPGFDTAARRFTLVVDMGSGSLRVR